MLRVEDLFWDSEWKWNPAAFSGTAPMISDEDIARAHARMREYNGFPVGSSTIGVVAPYNYGSEMTSVSIERCWHCGRKHEPRAIKCEGCAGPL